MLKAPIPEDESRRLASLHALALLDTPPEDRFDRNTRLARRMFGTAMALVSLVDANRQWFKSRQGLDATETPRDVSFCGHAILGSEPLVVTDTLRDERFADNPLVTNDPKIRFYAGFPLSAPDGSKIGTPCVVDPEPRAFTEKDVQLLRDLGETVEEELVAHRLATLDELTNLANRRGFLTVGQSSLELCRRLGRAATLPYFDLDDLKQINDAEGHAAGDRALRDFSAILWEAFRGSDVVARPGGDEFCALLAGTDASRCTAPLERLQAGVRTRNAASPGSIPLQ